MAPIGITLLKIHQETQNDGQDAKSSEQRQAFTRYGLAGVGEVHFAMTPRLNIV
jgi:hypothetical protein